MDALLHDLRAALRSLLRTPSLVLAAAACVLGLVFASWAIDMLRAAMPASIARYAAGWDDFALDGRFYAFGAVAAACLLRGCRRLAARRPRVEPGRPRDLGVASRDPFILGGVCLFLFIVAAAASWLPARRATRVDPAIALRAE